MSLDRAIAKIQTSAWGFSPTVHIPPADHTSKGIRLAHSSALLLAGLIEDTIAHSMPAVGWIVYVERGGTVASIRIELVTETEDEAKQALRLLRTVLEAARRLDLRDAAKAKAEADESAARMAVAAVLGNGRFA